MPVFQMAEHGRLPIGHLPGQIPAHLATRLAAAVQGTGFRAASVLEIRGAALQAGGVVGVVVAGDASLEILPKIDVPGALEPQAARGAIRNRLVHMLAVARNLRIDTGPQTGLGLQADTLLEVLIRAFCDSLANAVRRGMPRTYVGQDDDLPMVRGRLDLGRQYTRHAANPARLACRFDELSPDIALNRIMKATVGHLARMSRDPANQQRLRELALVHADVAAVPIPVLPWGDVVLDRTNRAWRDLFVMAQMILRQRHQTTSQGDVQGTALLFDMGALFEDYLGQLVVRALAGSHLRVTLQGGNRHCLTTDAGERNLFLTRPDILIRDGARIVHVIDTKWKRITHWGDDRKQGVSQADVYQMMAYAHLYAAPRLTLLYPHHPGLGQPEGLQSSFRITGLDARLETASINIADGREMTSRLLKQVLIPQDGAIAQTG